MCCNRDSYTLKALDKAGGFTLFCREACPHSFTLITLLINHLSYVNSGHWTTPYFSRIAVGSGVATCNMKFPRCPIGCDGGAGDRCSGVSEPIEESCSKLSLLSLYPSLGGERPWGSSPRHPLQGRSVTKRRTPSACLLGVNHVAALRAFRHLRCPIPHHLTARRNDIPCNLQLLHVARYVL